MALRLKDGVAQPIFGGVAMTTVGGVILEVTVTETVFVQPLSASVTVKT